MVNSRQLSPQSGISGASDETRTTDEGLSVKDHIHRLIPGLWDSNTTGLDTSSICNFHYLQLYLSACYSFARTMVGQTVLRNSNQDQSLHLCVCDNVTKLKSKGTKSSHYFSRWNMVSPNRFRNFSASACGNLTCRREKRTQVTRHASRV